MTEGSPSPLARLGMWLRSSAVPYLSVIAVATVLAPYMTYLIREDVRIKGQPLYIATELILVPVALVLWALYRGTRTRTRSVEVLLGLMLLMWATRMTLMFVHGDRFNHLVWLTPVFVVMVWLKAPPWRDTRTAITVLAYAVGAVLLSSYLLEVAGIYQPLYLPEKITEFQKQEYWLPLDGFPGIDGRWTGPLGHNTRAGFAAAVVFVVGIARWRWIGAPLIAIGTFFLLATSVRASYLAAFAGVGIIVLFSRRGLLNRVPAWARWTVLAGAMVLGGIGMVATGAGLTGREKIWPMFADLIPTSPWIGIGYTGIKEAGGRVAISGDAHNILLDELVRFGVVGFVVFAAFLVAVLFVCFRAANRGFTIGAALFAAYFVASLTDLLNGWLELSYHMVLVVLGALAAASWRAVQDEPDT